MTNIELHGPARKVSSLKNLKQLWFAICFAVLLVPKLAAAQVSAWGLDDYGQTDVPSGLTGVATITGGAFHSVALKSNGTVVVWGRNTYGQCNVPSGLTGVIAVSAGGGDVLALKSDGTVVA